MAVNIHDSLNSLFSGNLTRADEENISAVILSQILSQKVRVSVFICNEFSLTSMNNNNQHKHKTLF